MPKLDPKILDTKFELLNKDPVYLQDPFGFSPKNFEKIIRLLLPLYQDYFRVRSFGSQSKRAGVMVVANHSGQLPIDGVLLCMNYFYSSATLKILRPTAERFLMKLPFFSKLSLETGAILGDRSNCEYLLGQGQDVLAFPEGVRGISKSTSKFYQVQPFSNGFLKLALKYQSPIQPVAIIGAEEMYPYVIQLKWLAKLLGIPAFPLTPTFPFLLPLGLIPAPAPVDIYYLPAMTLPSNLSPDSPRSALAPFLSDIQYQIQEKIQEKLPEKRAILDEELRLTLKQKYEQLKYYLHLIKELKSHEK
jgi:1-acyl-sn-glycerol-3-phosphate acyltransferase